MGLIKLTKLQLPNTQEPEALRQILGHWKTTYQDLIFADQFE